jgi:Domain of unknown function (DUF4139)/N-terminal domain of unknown function (DUF4140)
MRIIIFGLSLVFFYNAHAQVKKLNAETAIQNVTIFSSGARIERNASVNIQSGRSEISFTGLSNQLDQQTVQLKADANIQLLSVQTMKDFLTERKVAEQEQEYIDRINALKDKLDLDQKQMDVYKNEEAMLIKNQAIGGENGVKTTELKEALEFQRQRLTEVYNKELEIQKHLITGEQDLKKSAMQLQEFSKKKDSISFIVTALVESKETRTVNFQLFYNVKDAGWYPSYDVRVTEINQPLSILMNANVFQRSGETWKNIPLMLSTGNPNDNATPSGLQPWMLGFYDPSVSFHPGAVQGEISGRITNDKGEPISGSSVTMKGSTSTVIADANGYFKLSHITRNSILDISALGYEKKEVSAAPGYLSISLSPSSTSLNEVVVVGYGLQSKAAGVEMETEEPKRKMKESIVQTVSVSTLYQPTATTYRIDEKYTLESDGKSTAIGIKQFEVPAIYSYYIAPKIDPAAFLTAKIVSWQDYDIQSGEASLYYEGSYLGKTYIDLGSATDTLSLSLGKDNGIKVSRKMLKEYSTKKFIGSNRTDSRLYEINIRNSKSLPVDITLVDQIPVSTNKEISVEEVKTADAQLDKDTGIATWIFTLPPSQEKKFEIGYSVKYPKDRKLILE